jgi:aryl-alcohol dehydrogenase-like predicted oxidoreductase
MKLKGEKYMDTKKLGTSDLYITTIGFGAWAIGGTGYEFAWGPQDDQDSIDAIRRALDLGINWIDTAPAYGVGHSEEIISTALAQWSGSPPLIFTKCGLRWDENGKISKNLSASSLQQECEDSLRRLNVETIDLLQIHWPTEEIKDIDEAWGTLAKLQKEGKIRWIGVSNFDVQQMQRAQAVAPITSLQPPYSLLRREIETDILPYCQQEGIGVIVYSPMYSGLLTGAMTRERAANLPDNDWRKRDVEFIEPNLSANLLLVERLEKIGARYGRSVGEVAIAWTLNHPAVTGAIVGTRSVKQVNGVMKAYELKLSETDIAEIESPITA